MSISRPIFILSAIVSLSLLCSTLQVCAQFNAMAPPSNSWSWNDFGFDDFTGDSSYNYDETNFYNPTNIIGLANPAAVYCEENGGTYQIRDTAEGQTGHCVFTDGSSCDAWDFYYGLCGQQTNEIIYDNSATTSSEIWFKGTAIERYEATGAGDASYWTVTVDERMSGPDPLLSPLKVITYQAISPPVWGEMDFTIKEGDNVEVYGKFEEHSPSYYRNCYVTLNGREEYYLRKVSDSSLDKCGNILDYSISSGKNYPRGQMILADMKYKTNLDTATDFKGVLKVKSPTGEVYIGEEVQKTFGFGTDHIDKFGYNKGNAIELRIPEDAATGSYSAKLELRRYDTDELCDETDWLQDQFAIKEESLGNCIDFDELEPGIEITGLTLHYDQVDFVVSPKSSAYIGDLSHSKPNGISLFRDGHVTIFFKVSTSNVSLWAGDWAGGTKISVYDDSRGVLLEEIEPQTDWQEYRFSYPGAEISSISISSAEGAFDDVCFSPSEARPLRLDFGDINFPSDTLKEYGGASHIIHESIKLGEKIDQDLDGMPILCADGDDDSGIDDEDGVVFRSPLIPGSTAIVEVTASCKGKLNAWLDFNRNGRLNDPGEQIFTDTELTSGLNTQNFQVPSEVAEGFTYVRFRFSSDGGLSLNGMAEDGEVEDYALIIYSFDYGDARKSYKTLKADDGARHKIVPGICLGDSIDGESDCLPSVGADLDDAGPVECELTRFDDEDGVRFTEITPGSSSTVEVTASASGKLNAWIDFNKDGDWQDEGEQIFVDEALSSGKNILTFFVPAVEIPDEKMDDYSYARFRFNSVGGLNYFGEAEDGEVEDYVVSTGSSPGHSSDNRPPQINDVLVEFPQYGGEMAFTVDATDLDGDAIYYQFWLKGPSTGDTWKVMRSWSENNEWTWPLSSSDIGWNSLRVWARDGKHSDTNFYDSEKMILGGNFYWGGDDTSPDEGEIHSPSSPGVVQPPILSNTGSARVIFSSSWLRGYSVLVDGSYVGGDGQGGDPLDGTYSLTVAGDQYHTLEISSGGQTYSEQGKFLSGYTYRLNL